MLLAYGFALGETMSRFKANKVPWRSAINPLLMVTHRSYLCKLAGWPAGWFSAINSSKRRDVHKLKKPHQIITTT